MTPAARVGAASMLILMGACRSTARGADPSAPGSGPGPSPAEAALLCKGSKPRPYHTVEFDPNRMPHPKAVRPQAPVLPPEAKSSGAQGTLSIKCVLKTDGALEDCCIL